MKALGVGSRGVQSVILPNKPGELACEECGMCIDICPVGALTSGTYRYQTRPWEMTYVGEPCTHCSNGCKTTLSVRNNEILRANNRDHSGFNGEFLCAKGRFGFDFTYAIPSAFASRSSAATASSSPQAGKTRSKKSRAA